MAEIIFLPPSLLMSARSFKTPYHPWQQAALVTLTQQGALPVSSSGQKRRSTQAVNGSSDGVLNLNPRYYPQRQSGWRLLQAQLQSCPFASEMVSQRPAPPPPTRRSLSQTPTQAPSGSQRVNAQPNHLARSRQQPALNYRRQASAWREAMPLHALCNSEVRLTGSVVHANGNHADPVVSQRLILSTLQPHAIIVHRASEHALCLFRECSLRFSSA